VIGPTNAGGESAGSPLFTLGRISATPDAVAVLTPQDILLGLHRHSVGNWGEISAADGEANNAALRYGGRILSMYDSTIGVRFWVVTEADRSVTTVMLPEDQ
jgi:hypothetical protein